MVRCSRGVDIRLMATNHKRKAVCKKKGIKALAVLAAAFISQFANASLVTVDMLTDSQFALSIGPVASNTLKQSLGQLPGAATFIGERTIVADLTGGPSPVAVLASVGGGNFTCDRSIGTTGVCDLIYKIDQDITLDRVLLGVKTDQTGVGNANLALYINGAATPVWTHTMGSLVENFNVTFGMTTFVAGTLFDLQSTGIAAVDFSAYDFMIDKSENRVPEPGSLALASIAVFGLGATRRRKSTTTADDSSVIAV